jgi:hypothetical protein
VLIAIAMGPLPAVTAPVLSVIARFERRPWICGCEGREGNMTGQRDRERERERERERFFGSNLVAEEEDSALRGCVSIGLRAARIAKKSDGRGK